MAARAAILSLAAVVLEVLPGGAEATVVTKKYSRAVVPSSAWTPSDTVPSTKSDLACASLASRRNKYLYSYSWEDQVCEVGSADLEELGSGEKSLMLRGISSKQSVCWHVFVFFVLRDISKQFILDKCQDVCLFDVDIFFWLQMSLMQVWGTIFSSFLLLQNMENSL